jgi:hypothetical protein
MNPVSAGRLTIYFTATSLLVVAFLGFPVRASSSCPGGVKRALVESLDTTQSDPLWDNSDIAKKRILALIDHQNTLRKARKIGLIRLVPNKIGDSSIRMPGSGHQYWIDDSDKFSYEAMGMFHVERNTLVRDAINDIFGLNYVYIFNREKLISAKPYAIWCLERSIEPEVVLYRAMASSAFGNIGKSQN